MEQSPFDVSERVFVVTGGSGLIGRSFVYGALAAGARVANLDMNDDEDERIGAVERQNYIFLRTDITDKNSVEAAANKVISRWGRVDVLVNNAAINDKFESPEAALEGSRFENFDLDNWNRSLQVNLTGTFLVSQVIGKIMADQGKGSIVNLASTYGMVGPDQSIYRDHSGTQTFFKTPSYPVTKGAILNFTRYLAAYWGDKGVRVNSLSPGGVEAGQDDWFIKNYSAKTLLGRMAGPDDYIGPMLFLASDSSAYMTGANLCVDGGWTAV